MKTLLPLSCVCAALSLAAPARAADVNELVQQLQSVDSGSRREAASALADLGAEAKPAVPALAQALRDKDLYVRRFAAKALGNLGADAQPAVPALAKALKDDKKQVAEAAADALGKVHPGQAGVTPLAGVLKDKNAETSVRRKAAEALGKIGSDAKDAVRALTDALKDREIRTEAAISLGEIGPGAKAAVPALSAGAAEKGKDKVFKKAAADALKKIQAGK